MGLLSRRALVVCLVVTLPVWFVSDSLATQTVRMQETQSFAPKTQITRVDVEIKTRNEKNAKIGSFHLLPGSDHVWLDLGFKAWDLTEAKTTSGAKPFRKNGATDKWDNLPLPADEAMSVDDIFEVRLEKKGLGGLTHAADGVDGGWRPESVTLYINGEPFGETLSVLPPGEELDLNRPAWRHLFRSIGTEERFRYGLRVERMHVERGLSRFEGLVALITTPFKKLKISGWQNGPLEQYRSDDLLTSDGDVKSDPLIARVGVEGVLCNPPHPGTDGYLTLDLKLDTITTFSGNGLKTEYKVNSESGISHHRFIRIEYVRKKWGQPNDNRYRTEKWAVGDQFYAEGLVRWDTDGMGFYEIHPQFGETFLRRIGK